MQTSRLKSLDRGATSKATTTTITKIYKISLGLISKAKVRICFVSNDCIVK